MQNQTTVTQKIWISKSSQFGHTKSPVSKYNALFVSIYSKFTVSFHIKAYAGRWCWPVFPWGQRSFAAKTNLQWLDCNQGSHIDLWTPVSYWGITKWTTVSSNTGLQAMDRCTYHGWGQRKPKSVAVSAGTMPRNKSHSCSRIALFRQLSREERGPRLKNSMWLKVGREAINVGYLEASSWNLCEEDLCLIKPDGSSCWWASSGRGRGARLCLPAGTPAW